MKVCPNCQSKYPDDANFCPQESCATRRRSAASASLIADEPPRRASSWIAQLGGSRSGEVWRARDTQTGDDGRLQAGGAGVAADARRRSSARSAS